MKCAKHIPVVFNFIGAGPEVAKVRRTRFDLMGKRESGLSTSES
jgi:hypothetical protein